MILKGKLSVSWKRELIENYQKYLGVLSSDSKGGWIYSKEYIGIDSEQLHKAGEEYLKDPQFSRAIHDNQKLKVHLAMLSESFIEY